MLVQVFGPTSLQGAFVTNGDAVGKEVIELRERVKRLEGATAEMRQQLWAEFSIMQDQVRSELRRVVPSADQLEKTRKELLAAIDATARPATEHVKKPPPIIVMNCPAYCCKGHDDVASCVICGDEVHHQVMSGEWVHASPTQASEGMAEHEASVQVDF